MGKGQWQWVGEPESGEVAGVGPKMTVVEINVNG